MRKNYIQVKSMILHIRYITQIMLFIVIFTGIGCVEKKDDTNNQNYLLKRNKSNLFNRPPLKEKPYTELPLTAIKPKGWLKEQLQRMADGSTGHLDELYAEVVGLDNGWLGGDGDQWERGPYWIDGLLPLAYQLENEMLLDKALKWVEWTLNNQREDGYIGPLLYDEPLKNKPPLQRERSEDWWPKMVMLKILQQYYSASGDKRVIDCLTRYFRYQLRELPHKPLDNWSWWGKERGGENLMIIYWLYNITGDAFLLELGDLVYEQTTNYSQIFREGKMIPIISKKREAFHCVNLAMGIKTPAVRYQADADSVHLKAIDSAFDDIEKYHGQPYGLFGGDEMTHGRELTCGSELCTAVEMMFSLEKLLETTGNLSYADKLEMVAYNALPTQISDDFMTRQYYQQANQVMCTIGNRRFWHDGGDRIIFGLITGLNYVSQGTTCCTCNMHQGWPKFTRHLWMASSDNGLAALVYAPCHVTATVADGKIVTIVENTNYPFEDTITFNMEMENNTFFPFHLRIPEWCKSYSVLINGKEIKTEPENNLVVIERKWKNGDEVTLNLPSGLRVKRWDRNTASIYKGPLLLAMPIETKWWLVNGYREARPTQPWNYALFESEIKNPEKYFSMNKTNEKNTYPWSEEGSPLYIQGDGIILTEWGLENNNMAARQQESPLKLFGNVESKNIRLIPYGCTTLRISAFPTVERIAQK